MPTPCVAGSPKAQADTVQLATSDERDAHQTLARYRLRVEPSVLVTVAMAYEGLDAPEVAVMAALTHIRSRAWLEQMVARATRVDPHAGPYAGQRALVFHPDDPLFARFRHSVETEQGMVAKRVKAPSQPRLPEWLRDELADADREEGGIVPLEATCWGCATACCGPARTTRCTGPNTRRRKRRCWTRLRCWSAVCASAWARW